MSIEPKNVDVVALLSGGVDSTTLLYRLVRHDKSRTLALCVHYGQRHAREMESAAKVAAALEVELRVVDLTALAGVLPSALTDPTQDVPEGHYEDESMRHTVVPGRNMILLAVAGAVAAARGADYVAYGAHAGDHAIYPDCRPEFAQDMAAVLRRFHYKPINLLTPFLNLSKGDIVAEGDRLQVPYVLTWTCYKGGEHHCGKCGACVERREAFHDAGVADPTTYEEGD